MSISLITQNLKKGVTINGIMDEILISEVIYWVVGALIFLFILEFLFFFKDIMNTDKVKFKGIKAKEKESFWVIVIAYLICFVVILGEFVKFPPTVTYYRYVGVGLFFIGGFLRMLARRELNKFFTFQVMIQEGHKLIKKGLYRYVRHPSYLGNILVMLGIALSLSRIFGVVVVLVFFVPAVLFRIGGEEKMLIEEFGKDYLNYMQKTKKLIPFIY